jgi:UrcA family protein
MKMITSLAALLAVSVTAAAGIGHVAHAQPTGLTIAVHYGDLDLGTQDGRTALDRRIGNAIRTACGTPSPADLRGQNEAADCRSELRSTLAAQRDTILAGAGSSRTTLIARR